VAIAVGPPCEVARGTDAAGVERVQRELERQLHATFRAARQALEAA
jgi:hypothetical protein